MTFSGFFLIFVVCSVNAGLIWTGDAAFDFSLGDLDPSTGRARNHGAFYVSDTIPTESYYLNVKNGVHGASPSEPEITPDVGVPPQLADPGDGSLPISGWDIKRIYFQYDYLEDVLNIGIDCFGICGDADGDGDPGAASPVLTQLGGQDLPNLARAEGFALLIDFDLDVADVLPSFVPDINVPFDYIIGVPAGQPAGASANPDPNDPNSVSVLECTIGRSQNELLNMQNCFGVYEYQETTSVNVASRFLRPKEFVGGPWLAENHFPVLSAAHPDLEWSIGALSLLRSNKGASFVASPMEPWTLLLQAVGASFVDDGIGEDFLPSQTSYVEVNFPCLEVDVCDVCLGDGSTCLDCAGVPNGPNVILDCGCSDDFPNGCPAPTASPTETPAPSPSPLNTAAPGTKFSITWSGNAEDDFTLADFAFQGRVAALVISDSNGPVVHSSPFIEASFFEFPDVGVPSQLQDPMAPAVVSGWDISRIYMIFDPDSDEFHIGIDCFGVCGDADGDNDPDAASSALRQLGGNDFADLGQSETFIIAMDFDLDVANVLPSFAPDISVPWDVLIGVPGGVSGNSLDCDVGQDIPLNMNSCLGVYEYASASRSSLASRITGPVLRSGEPWPIINRNPFPALFRPDLEWSVPRFTELRLLMGAPPGSSPFESWELLFQAYAGSFDDDGIGEDFLPSQTDYVQLAFPCMLFDECDICLGDSSSCADCDGVPNGPAVLLSCGCSSQFPNGICPTPSPTPVPTTPAPTPVPTTPSPTPSPTTPAPTPAPTPSCSALNGQGLNCLNTVGCGYSLALDVCARCSLTDALDCLLYTGCGFNDVTLETCTSVAPTPKPTPSPTPTPAPTLTPCSNFNGQGLNCLQALAGCGYSLSLDVCQQCSATPIDDCGAFSGCGTGGAGDVCVPVAPTPEPTRPPPTPAPSTPSPTTPAPTTPSPTTPAPTTPSPTTPSPTLPTTSAPTSAAPSPAPTQQPSPAPTPIVALISDEGEETPVIIQASAEVPNCNADEPSLSTRLRAAQLSSEQLDATLRSMMICYNEQTTGSIVDVRVSSPSPDNSYNSECSLLIQADSESECKEATQSRVLRVGTEGNPDAGCSGVCIIHVIFDVPSAKRQLSSNDAVASIPLISVAVNVPLLATTTVSPSPPTASPTFRPIPLDCAGNPYGTLVYDICDVCNGDGSSCRPARIPVPAPPQAPSPSGAPPPPPPIEIVVVEDGNVATESDLNPSDGQGILRVRLPPRLPSDTSPLPTTAPGETPAVTLPLPPPPDPVTVTACCQRVIELGGSLELELNAGEAARRLELGIADGASSEFLQRVLVITGAANQTDSQGGQSGNDDDDISLYNSVLIGQYKNVDVQLVDTDACPPQVETIQDLAESSEGLSIFTVTVRWTPRQCEMEATPSPSNGSELPLCFDAPGGLPPFSCYIAYGLGLLLILVCLVVFACYISVQRENRKLKANRRRGASAAAATSHRGAAEMRSLHHHPRRPQAGVGMEEAGGDYIDARDLLGDDPHDLYHNPPAGSSKGGSRPGTRPSAAGSSYTPGPLNSRSLRGSSRFRGGPSAASSGIGDSDGAYGDLQLQSGVNADLDFDVNPYDEAPRLKKRASNRLSHQSSSRTELVRPRRISSRRIVPAVPAAAPLPVQAPADYGSLRLRRQETAETVQQNDEDVDMEQTLVRRVSNRRERNSNRSVSRQTSSRRHHHSSRSPRLPPPAPSVPVPRTQEDQYDSIRMAPLPVPLTKKDVASASGDALSLALSGAGDYEVVIEALSEDSSTTHTELTDDEKEGGDETKAAATKPQRDSLLPFSGDESDSGELEEGKVKVEFVESSNESSSSGSLIVGGSMSTPPRRPQPPPARRKQPPVPKAAPVVVAAKKPAPPRTPVSAGKRLRSKKNLLHSSGGGAIRPTSSSKSLPTPEELLEWHMAKRTSDVKRILPQLTQSKRKEFSSLLKAYKENQARRKAIRSKLAQQ